MLLPAKYAKLDLWQELEAAACELLTADLSGLCQKLEQTLEHSDDLDQSQKLLLAGEAISQILNVYVLRAKAILDALEIKDDSEGPVLSEEFLDELMRQSMAIDLSNLMEDLFDRAETPLPSKTKVEVSASPRPADKPTTRAITPLASKDARKMVVDLAGDKQVSEWTKAIASWMQRNCSEQAVSLVELQQGLGMPMVEVWLGLLLGGQFELEQSGDFYEIEGVTISGGSSGECVSPLLLVRS